MPSRFATSNERGGALVELALGLPLLALVLFGTIDFGRVFYHAMAVSHAARAGAQYGSQNLGYAMDDSAMSSVATTDATAHDLSASFFTVTSSHACYCYDGSAETSLACTAGTCASQLRVYVTVTASHGFTTVASYPGIPHTLTVTRAARMRAQ